MVKTIRHRAGGSARPLNIANVAGTVGAAASRAPIFVVGAMRSGTTLLRLMLNEHPEVAIPAESHFVASLLRTFSPTAVLAGPDLLRAVEIVASSPEWQRDYDADEAALRDAVGTGHLSLGAFIERVFRLEVGMEPRRWGDKTPAYLTRVDQLLTCFPDAQVVAIVRDPRDVYLSLATRDWVGETTWDIGRYLAQYGRFVARWRAAFDDAHFRVVRYEDLVLRTEPTLRSLCEYLGLPFAAEMEAFFEGAEQNVQQWELDIGAHTKLLRRPAPSDVARWRREGTRLQHAEIEALTVAVVDDHGYERRVPGAAVPVLRLEPRARHHARSPGDALARVARRITPERFGRAVR
jgi:hypothetical protein